MIALPDIRVRHRTDCPRATRILATREQRNLDRKRGHRATTPGGPIGRGRPDIGPDESGHSMNPATRMIFAIALVAVAAIFLLFGSALMSGHMSGTGTMGSGGTIGAGLSDYGGYLMLTLIVVGLGTVVAWMLFGNRD
jgi:hypothetical protein